MYLFALCILIRALLVTTAALLSIDHLFYMAIITSVIGIGFWIIFLGKLRMKAPESGGKEKTFWHNWRPVHGTLYLLFSILVFLRIPLAWIALLLDLLIGIGVWSHKRL